MKTAVFNFFVLQIVVWAFVFSTNDQEQKSDVNYASISDTWEVAQIGENSSSDIILHYPSFNKLTLHPDGVYIRFHNDEAMEQGNWKLNEEKSKLTLVNNAETKNFDIVQLPSSNSESFIIKENVSKANLTSNIKYELTRM